MSDKNIKHIGIVVSPMEPGGAQRAAVSLKKNFEKYDIEVDLIYLTKKESFYENLEKIHVVCESYPDSLFAKMKGLWRYYQLVYSLNCDVRLDFTKYPILLGGVLDLFTASKNSLSCHRGSIHEYGCLINSLISFLVFWGVIDKQITVSKEIKEQVLRRYSAKLDPEDVQVIYNGVDWISSSLTQKEARDKFCLPTNKKILLSVGRIVKLKNHRMIIQAIKHLKKIRGDVHFALAGDGPLKNKLIDLTHKYGVENEVTFLGHVKEDDINDFYSAGDLFVFPSEHEGCPNALLEAAYSGLPIICSNIKAHRELFSEEEVKFCSLEDGCTELLDQIEEILSSSEEMKRLGENVQKKSRKFDINLTVKRFLDVIKDSE